MEFYGILPVIPSILIYVLSGILVPQDWLNETEIFRLTLHLSAFVYGMSSTLLLRRLVYLCCEDRFTSNLSALFLLTYPAWLGHSFFNYKDLPLAFFVLLATVAAVLAIKHPQEKMAQAVVLLVVASVGAACVKLASAPLLMVQWIAVFGAIFDNRGVRQALVLAGFAAFATVLLIYCFTPAAWANPIEFTMASVRFMGMHPFRGCMTAFSQCIGSGSPLWSTFGYLQDWFSVRLPLPVLILVPPGLVFLLGFGKSQHKVLALCLIVPMGLIVLRNSNLYDGIRHVLFVVPLLIAVMMVTLYHISKANYWAGLVGKTAVLASLIMFVADNITLFPYNYVYFNEYGRKFATPEQFDLEYWGFSLREASHRVNAITCKDETASKIYHSANPSHLANPFMKCSKPTNVRTKLEAGEVKYVLSYTRTNKRPPKACELVDHVSRTLTFAEEPLNFSYIARCDAK
jgi:hypothetical protein